MLPKLQNVFLLENILLPQLFYLDALPVQLLSQVYVGALFRLKTAPSGLKTPQDVPKTPPRRPRDAPRRTQDAPRSFQDAPQEAPKRVLKHIKIRLPYLWSTGPMGYPIFGLREPMGYPIFGSIF